MTTDGIAVKEVVPTTNEVLFEIAVAAICQQIDRVANELGAWNYGGYRYADTAVVIQHDHESSLYTVELRQPLGDQHTTKVWRVSLSKWRGEITGRLETIRPGLWLGHLAKLNAKAEAAIESRRITDALIDNSHFAPVDDRFLFLSDPQPIVPSPEEPTLAEQLLSLLRQIVRSERYDS